MCVSKERGRGREDTWSGVKRSPGSMVVMVVVMVMVMVKVQSLEAKITKGNCSPSSACQILHLPLFCGASL